MSSYDGLSAARMIHDGPPLPNPDGMPDYSVEPIWFPREMGGGPGWRCRTCSGKWAGGRSEHNCQGELTKGE